MRGIGLYGIWAAVLLNGCIEETSLVMMNAILKVTKASSPQSILACYTFFPEVFEKKKKKNLTLDSNYASKKETQFLFNSHKLHNY